MSISVDGNDNFRRVENTLTEGSAILTGVQSLVPTAPFAVPSGGVAAGNLTAAQLQTAMNGGPLGLGLLLDGTGGAYLFIGATSAANAASVQSALGLQAVGDAKLLTFYWVDVPAADATINPAGGANIVVTSLGEANAVIFESTPAGAGGPQNFQAKVLVSAGNVTAGAEVVNVNILQRGGIST